RIVCFMPVGRDNVGHVSNVPMERASWKRAPHAGAKRKQRGQMTQRLLISVCCLLFLGCGSSQPKPLVVFAAASTQEPLRKIAARFEAETGLSVELSFEASSTLAMQIEKGAHADLFLSADEDWADYLDKHNLCEAKRDLLTNQLVVIVPAE